MAVSTITNTGFSEATSLRLHHPALQHFGLTGFLIKWMDPVLFWNTWHFSVYFRGCFT